MVRSDPIPQDLRKRAATLEIKGHKSGVTPSPSSNISVPSVTLLRFAEMEPPGPREYLAEGIVPQGHTTTIFGDGGSAKSVLALSVGTAVAGGADKWLDRRVQNCPVLYGDFELDADEQRRRAYQGAGDGSAIESEETRTESGILVYCARCGGSHPKPDKGSAETLEDVHRRAIPP